MSKEIFHPASRELSSAAKELPTIASVIRRLKLDSAFRTFYLRGYLAVQSEEGPEASFEEAPSTRVAQSYWHLLYHRLTYFLVAFVLTAVNTLLYFIAWVISLKRDSNWDSEAFRFGFTGMISLLCFGIVFSLVWTTPISTPTTRATAQIQVGSTFFLIMLLLFGVFALRISNLGDSPSCLNGDIRCSIITAMTSIGLLSPVPLIAAARITYLAAGSTDFVALGDVSR